MQQVAGFFRSNAIALLALFVAVGGTAYAAPKIITGKTIKNNSITGADVNEPTLICENIPNCGISGPRGPQGPQGPPGPAGESAGSVKTRTYRQSFPGEELETDRPLFTLPGLGSFIGNCGANIALESHAIRFVNGSGAGLRGFVEYASPDDDPNIGGPPTPFANFTLANGAERILVGAGSASGGAEVAEFLITPEGPAGTAPALTHVTAAIRGNGDSACDMTVQVTTDGGPATG